MQKNNNKYNPYKSPSSYNPKLWVGKNGKGFVQIEKPIMWLLSHKGLFTKIEDFHLFIWILEKSRAFGDGQGNYQEGIQVRKQKVLTDLGYDYTKTNARKVREAFQRIYSQRMIYFWYNNIGCITPYEKGRFNIWNRDFAPYCCVNFYPDTWAIDEDIKTKIEIKMKNYLKNPNDEKKKDVEMHPMPTKEPQIINADKTIDEEEQRLLDELDEL